MKRVFLVVAIILGSAAVFAITMITIAITAANTPIVGEFVVCEIAGVHEGSSEDSSSNFCHHVEDVPIDDVPKVAELYFDDMDIVAQWEVFSPKGNYIEGFCDVNVYSVEDALEAIECIPENYNIEVEGKILTRSEVEDIIRENFG